jgi:hypothetical protein
MPEFNHKEAIKRLVPEHEKALAGIKSPEAITRVKNRVSIWVQELPPGMTRERFDRLLTRARAIGAEKALDEAGVQRDAQVFVPRQYHQPGASLAELERKKGLRYKIADLLREEASQPLPEGFAGEHIPATPDHIWVHSPDPKDEDDVFWHEYGHHVEKKAGWATHDWKSELFAEGLNAVRRLHSEPAGKLASHYEEWSKRAASEHNSAFGTLARLIRKYPDPNGLANAIKQIAFNTEYKIDSPHHLDWWLGGQFHMLEKTRKPEPKKPGSFWEKLGKKKSD